jgi:hypothetical protein
MSIDRADLLRASTTLTGIDLIAVSPSQTVLTVFLQHDVLPAAVAAQLAALPVDDIHIEAIGAVDPARVPVLQSVSPLPPPVDGRAVLQFLTAMPGGFGDYRLRIDSPAIDPYFNNVRFSFKAACDSDLDCETEPRPCPPDERIDFPVDYRARDFWSFRRALTDFAAQRYPEWQDRLEADIGMMVLELTAALGDEFAYANDRLNREGRLDQASQRRSLRHLARLVDYPLDDGAGAFAWIDVQASAAGFVDAGTAITDAQRQLVFEIGRGLADRPIALPPKAPAKFAIDPARNEIPAYIWDENDTCLLAGTTELTITGAHETALQPDNAIDPKGRWVLLLTRPPSPDIPERRLAVRLKDARDEVDPLTAAPITRLELETPALFDLDLETLVLRANLLPATAGAYHETRFRIGPPDDPADPDARLPMAVERVGPDSTVCYPDPGSASDLAARVKTLFSLAGSDETPLVWHADKSGALRPEVQVLCEDEKAEWEWRPSLVGETTAEPDDALFTLEDGLYRRVVGFERFGKVTELIDYATGEGTTLRFGDGEFGMAPAAGSRFTVRYRLGNGSRGNVAPDTLTVLPIAVAGVLSVNNPLAGTGGRDPETAQAIRTNAPQAFRAITHRAVQPDDYARIAERDPAVQKAGATSRWTGSWPTIFVTPDPHETTIVSAGLRKDLMLLLNRARQAGREVKLMEPRYADFDLEIRLCVAANAYRGEVEEAALAALFGTAGQGGGFFDPDNFTFGMPLSRAALIAALQGVPGVRGVEAMRVRRPGYFEWRSFDELTLPVGLSELVRVTNSRALPERGAVRLIMEGGA